MNNNNYDNLQEKYIEAIVEQCRSTYMKDIEFFTGLSSSERQLYIEMRDAIERQAIEKLLKGLNAAELANNEKRVGKILEELLNTFAKRRLTLVLQRDVMTTADLYIGLLMLQEKMIYFSAKLDQLTFYGEEEEEG